MHCNSKTLKTSKLLPNWRPFTRDGFTLTETIVTTAIVGILSSIALPNYMDTHNKTKLANTKAIVVSIPPIISAFADETGEPPTKWEDLASISVVMTDDGPATGDLETTITLPEGIYDLTIEGPTNSIYTMTSKRLVDRSKGNLEQENENNNENVYRFAIKSCFNISNGASDLKSGMLSDIEDKLNCG